MEIETRLKRFILDEILLSEQDMAIDPDQSLVSSGILDSLAILRMIAFIEEEFSVAMGDDDVVPENFETLNAMKSFIRRKLQATET